MLTSAAQLVLGAQQTLLNFLTGDIAEEQIYNTPLGDPDRQQLETVLENKYLIGTAPPRLTACISANNTLTLIWFSSSSAFTLWRATNLAPPINWLAVTNWMASSNGQWTAELAPVTGRGFFRLAAP